jgi:hypothetical protein
MSLSGAVGRSPHAPHLCGACGLPLVQPGEWEQEGARWRVVLHCPNCGWESEQLLDRPAVDRFDDELDRGFEQLNAELIRMTDVNMREYIDRFCAGLAANAILPEDF